MSKQIWPPSAKILAFNINAINRIKLMLKQIWPPSAKILAFNIVNEDFTDFRILARSLARSSGISDVEKWFYEASLKDYMIKKRKPFFVFVTNSQEHCKNCKCCPVSKLLNLSRIVSHCNCLNQCWLLAGHMFPPMHCNVLCSKNHSVSDIVTYWAIWGLCLDQLEIKKLIKVTIYFLHLPYRRWLWIDCVVCLILPCSSLVDPNL